MKGPLLILIFQLSLLYPYIESREVNNWFAKGIKTLPTYAVLSSQEIVAINDRGAKKGWIHSPANRNFTIPTRIIKSCIISDFEYVMKYGAYNYDNTFIAEKERDSGLEQNLNIDEIGTLFPTGKPAIINRPSNLRLLPSDIYRMRKKNDFHFDVLQIEFLNIWDPVRVFHISTDGQWLYVQSLYSRGWIQFENISFLPESTITKIIGDPTQPLLNTQKKIIITAAEIKAHCIETGETISFFMGDTLPLSSEENGKYLIAVPGTPEVRYTIDKTSDIITSHPILSQKAAAELAIKMLGENYSWGGYLGNTDCSGFLSRVFAVFGIILPRSSISQIEVLRQFSWNNGATLSSLVPWLSFIQLNGHIMLYIGKFQNERYVLHNVWGYHDKNNVHHIIGRVALTDMNLGAGGKYGSLRSRVIGVANISNPQK